MSKLNINLGCGKNIIKDYYNIDVVDGPGIDHVMDLTKDKFPFEDNSVDSFVGNDLLEHIPNPLFLLEQMYIVAKPGALATFSVPYGTSDDAWEDPTHVRPYFTGSFAYFSQLIYKRADYGYRGDWDIEHIELKLEAKRFKNVPVQEMSKAITSERNVVVKMIATLIAVKPIRIPGSEEIKQQNILITFV